MIVLSPNTHPQGSDPWLQARVGACTASRFSDARSRVGGLTDQQAKYVAALKGGHDPKTALAMAGYQKKPTAAGIEKALSGLPTDEPSDTAIKYAWLIAIETIARKPLDDTFVTYAMRRGQEMEPYARAVYERRTGAWVEEVSLILTDDERFGYSADGFRDDDGLVEIKCPMACDKLGQVWENPDHAHLEYIDQINGGLWITGRKYCDLVVYCPWLEPVGKDLFVKRIYRNEEAIQALEDDLTDFLRMVDGFLEILRRPVKMSGKVKDEGDPEQPAAPTLLVDANQTTLADAPPWDAPARASSELPASIF